AEPAAQAARAGCGRALAHTRRPHLARTGPAPHSPLPDGRLAARRRLMTDNRAFSHVNVAVGSFVLLALLVLVAIIVQGGRIRDWFSPSVTLTLQLPPEGSHGLKEGSRVLVMGTEVGTIRRILFGARGGDHMYAEARIREAFM